MHQTKKERRAPVKWLEGSVRRHMDQRSENIDLIEDVPKEVCNSDDDCKDTQEAPGGISG